MTCRWLSPSLLCFVTSFVGGGWGWKLFVFSLDAVKVELEVMRRWYIYIYTLPVLFGEPGCFMPYQARLSKKLSDVTARQLPLTAREFLRPKFAQPLIESPRWFLVGCSFGFGCSFVSRGGEKGQDRAYAHRMRLDMRILYNKRYLPPYCKKPEGF